MINMDSDFKVTNYDNLWNDFYNSLQSFVGKNPTKLSIIKDDKGSRKPEWFT